MPTIKYSYSLNKEEVNHLKNIVAKGKHNSSKVINALILLNCNNTSDGHKPSDTQIAEILQIRETKIWRIKKRFVEEGLQIALDGHKGKRVYAKKADGDFEAHLVALCCTEPPEGHAQWSLRLLADQVVTLEYVESISHETIRRTLKKTSLNLGKRRDG